MGLTLLSKSILLLSLFVLIVLSAVAKRDFIMKVKNIECQSTPIMNMTCTQTKSNRVAGFNMYIKFTADEYDLRYDFELLHLNKKGQWNRFYKFTNLNVCEFLSAKSPFPILVIVRNTMRKFSNLPEDCPLRKDINYYVQGMKMDPEMFPPYFPEGQFESNSTIYNKTHVLGGYNIRIQAISKKKF